MGAAWRAEVPPVLSSPHGGTSAPDVHGSDRAVERGLCPDSDPRDHCEVGGQQGQCLRGSVGVEKRLDGSFGVGHVPSADLSRGRRNVMPRVEAHHHEHQHEKSGGTAQQIPAACMRSPADGHT